MNEQLVGAARGKAPADLLLRDGWILDVFSGAFFRGDVAVKDGIIVGFGASEAKEVVDLDGAWLIPGLIDAHMHIESSQLTPAEFARAVLPHGTTTVMADPHEIANVLGLDGIRYMLDATEGLPLRVFFMVPSCVPATPLETSGAELSAMEISEALSWKRVIGLGEVMNFPGVIEVDPAVHAKLAAARGRPIDGHAPGLSGPDLWAYALSGPRTDHECTTLAEAQEKLRAGMHILIREGTTSRNLNQLLPLLTERSAPFVHFCTDDRHPKTLLHEGHMDDLVRKAITGGTSPEIAIAASTLHTARAYGLPDLGAIASTLHTARAYGLPDLGAIAPGYRADLLVISNLDSLKVARVYVDGQLVAEDGCCTVDLPLHTAAGVRGTMRVNLERLSFRIPAGRGAARAIGVIPDQAVTEDRRVEALIEDGEVIFDLDQDLLKLAVVERHRGTGNIGLGLVQGFDLKRGALASTVAHDSHNIVVVGTNDPFRSILPD
jgi:adenine deaminase